jgi:hypothetical protein
MTVNDFSVYYWVLFANALLRTFAYMHIEEIGQYCSFFVVSLPGFGIRIILPSYNQFGSIPSLCSCGRDQEDHNLKPARAKSS